MTGVIHKASRRLPGFLLLAAALPLWPGRAADEIKPGDQVQFVTEDIRVVNGVKVDLRPVHNWLHYRKGKRPMAHWQQIQVFQIKENYAAAWDRCIVKNESGEFIEIFLDNLPSTLKDYFETRKKLENEIAALRARLEVEEKQVREFDAVTPDWPWGPYVYSPEIMENRAEVNLAAERLRQRKMALVKLETELENLRASATQRTTDLAMFTGRRHSNLQVWDCGWKRK